jgi:hypothetical protein
MQGEPYGGVSGGDARLARPAIRRAQLEYGRQIGGETGRLRDGGEIAGDLIERGRIERRLPQAMCTPLFRRDAHGLWLCLPALWSGDGSGSCVNCPT